jgi:hypothetical protein
MMYHRLLTLLLLSFLAACKPTPSDHGLDDDSPFGLWQVTRPGLWQATRTGQTLDVRRDGTYRFCDASFCEEGKTMPDTKAVWLLGFSNMKATKRLREDSGTEADDNGDSSDAARRNAWQLYGNGAPQSLQDDLCDGRPCSLISVGGRGGDYAFMKMKDY